MTRTGTIIAIGYLLLVVVSALVAVAVWLTTRSPRETDTPRLAARETRWAVALVLLLTGLLFATIFFTPYAETAPHDAQRVEVEGSQFAWRVQPDRVRVDEPVEFTLTATDVNHALGIYDEDGTLVFQVQAMPDETQRSVHTFDEPGTYEVLCLEFCGFGHHLMETTIEVTG